MFAKTKTLSQHNAQYVEERPTGVLCDKCKIELRRGSYAEIRDGICKLQVRCTKCHDTFYKYTKIEDVVKYGG